jgi:wyosine [tRNA(Phe)-imidazoG37] synthetase (radical SAM superfamily)
VREALAGGAEPDYLTLSGSGEPTLNSRFGEVAERLKELSGIPVALVTNSTLLHLPEVRTDFGSIDLVLPSLDAGDEETFRRLNRPHGDVRLADVVEGLRRLREERSALMWLEVFVVPGVNTGEEQVEALVEAVKRIDPHRVQLNTAVRPPAEEGVRAASRETLEWIQGKMGPQCEIIVPADAMGRGRGEEGSEEDILGMLRRRPCTVDEVAAGLSMDEEEALAELEALRRAGRVEASREGDTTYYRAAD